MPSEINIEQMIREAIERGDFDKLKGKGKPLDLDAYFSTPEDIRMAYSLLKSNDYVPEGVDMLREIADLKEALKTPLPSDKRADLEKRLHDRRLALNLSMEKHKRKR